MLNKKILSTALAVTSAAGLLAGCGSTTAGPQSAATSGTTGSGEHEAVSLRFMWWGGDARAQATVDVIKKFEEKYPWISIEPEYGSDDGYQEKLTAQLNAGTEADIIQMGVGWMPGFVSSGADYFADFNDYSGIIDLSSFDAAFLKNNGNFEGHQYGLTTGLAGTALIYDTEEAKSLGIDGDMAESMDWQKLHDIGVKVHQSDPEKYFLTMDSTMMTTAILRPYLLQKTGNTFFIDKTKEMGFSKDDLIEVLSYIKSLYDDGVIAPASSTESYKNNLQTDPNWINGTYLSMFCYTSTAEPAVKASGREYAAANLPVMAGAKDDGFYCNCPQYMVVSKRSKNIDAAMTFLNYFYNDEEAAKILGTVRSVPPTAIGQKVCQENGLLNGVAKETVDICQKYNGTYEMGLSTEEEPMTIMKDMIMQVAYGEKSPEDAAGNAITLFQNYLDSKK